MKRNQLYRGRICNPRFLMFGLYCMMESWGKNTKFLWQRPKMIRGQKHTNIPWLYTNKNLKLVQYSIWKLGSALNFKNFKNHLNLTTVVEYLRGIAIRIALIPVLEVSIIIINRMGRQKLPIPWPCWVAQTVQIVGLASQIIANQY